MNVLTHFKTVHDDAARHLLLDRMTSPSTPAISLPNALRKGFDWSSTPKSHMYWSRLGVSLIDYPQDLCLRPLLAHLCTGPQTFLEPLYAKARLKEEASFIAGASAALHAVFGDPEDDSLTNYVPPKWIISMMTGRSILDEG